MTQGKVVIVSGGTFGIGRDISLDLAAAGHQVVAYGVNAKQLSSTAENSVEQFRREVRDLGAHIDAIEADITDSAALEQVVEGTVQKHGRVDALINNAAIGPLGTVVDTTESVFDAVMAVNLKGTYLCSRLVIPHLQQNDRGGSIVNIGSGAGWGKPNMAAYAASKGGMFALSASMAYDFFHDNIRVNTVVPGGGGIQSGITWGRSAGDRIKAQGSVAGRPVEGHDVAHTVNFLISDAAAAISGTVVDVGCFANQGGPLKRRVTP